MKELLDHATNDKEYLERLITYPLTQRQWAALLSFSYNLGPGDADNLVNNINSADWDSLQTQWNKYIYINRQINQHQIDRRAAEWQLFSS